MYAYMYMYMYKHFVDGILYLLDQTPWLLFTAIFCGYFSRAVFIINPNRNVYAWYL